MTRKTTWKSSWQLSSPAPCSNSNSDCLCRLPTLAPFAPSAVKICEEIHVYGFVLQQMGKSLASPPLSLSFTLPDSLALSPAIYIYLKICITLSLINIFYAPVDRSFCMPHARPARSPTHNTTSNDFLATLFATRRPCGLAKIDPYQFILLAPTTTTTATSEAYVEIGYEMSESGEKRNKNKNKSEL